MKIPGGKFEGRMEALMSRAKRTKSTRTSVIIFRILLFLLRKNSVGCCLVVYPGTTDSFSPYRLCVVRIFVLQFSSVTHTHKEGSIYDQTRSKFVRKERGLGFFSNSNSPPTRVYFSFKSSL